MNRCFAVVLLVPMAFLLAGCSRNARPTGQQARVIKTQDQDAVLVAAAKLLRREFGRVHTSEDGRSVVTEPAEYSTTRDSGTARDLYRGRSTMRRVARFSVGRRGGDTIARLRIDIERQDTARMRSFRPDVVRISDSPAYTPIDRDAATTEEQNTVWSFVRRDQRLERLLLRELQELFAAPPTEPTAAEQPAGDQADSPP